MHTLEARRQPIRIGAQFHRTRQNVCESYPEHLIDFLEVQSSPMFGLSVILPPRWMMRDVAVACLTRAKYACSGAHQHTFSALYVFRGSATSLMTSSSSSSL